MSPSFLLFVQTVFIAAPLSKSTCFCPCEAFLNDSRSIQGRYRRTRAKYSSHLAVQPFPVDPKNQKYLRLQSRTIGGNGRRVDFQSAIVSLVKYTETGRTLSVDLHALCHFGDKGYFDYFNNKHGFTDTYDRVHYELLLSKNLLTSHPDEDSRYIAPDKDIAPSPQDDRMAKQYQLSCQLDVIDYSQPRWVHCDYTREEFITLVTGNSSYRAETTQPLWALASTQSSIPALEFVSALLRPLTPSVPLSSSFNRRLFSNLFLSGDAMISLLRFLLWFLMPSPELSVMLLDWSSLFPRPLGSISPIVNPVWTSLFSGDFLSARKLVFAQMLTSGQASSIRSQEDWIVQKRNENAIQKIQTSMDTWGHDKHAVLYGALHCQDLQHRLECMGFFVKKIDYRTVWSVTIPEFGTGRAQVDRTRNNVVGEGKISWGNFATFVNSGDVSLALVVIPLYFLAGGLDWLDTVKSMISCIDTADSTSCLFVTVLYLIRHIALYLVISKFFIDWDGPSNLFEGDDDETNMRKEKRSVT